MFFERACAGCGEAPGPVCALCAGALRRARPTAFGVRAAFVLDDASRPIVAALKYRGERWLAAWVGSRLVGLVPRGADAVCWIPATPARVRWRGYDQGREIARVVGRETGIPVRPLLRRDRRDRRQTAQSRSDRLDGPRLQSTRTITGLVVLIDDVVTTGATMRAGVNVLREAGAERVIPVALAATPPPSGHDK